MRYSEGCIYLLCQSLHLFQYAHLVGPYCVILCNLTNFVCVHSYGQCTKNKNGTKLDSGQDEVYWRFISFQNSQYLYILCIYIRELILYIIDFILEILYFLWEKNTCFFFILVMRCYQNTSKKVVRWKKMETAKVCLVGAYKQTQLFWYSILLLFHFIVIVNVYKELLSAWHEVYNIFMLMRIVTSVWKMKLCCLSEK